MITRVFTRPRPDVVALSAPLKREVLFDRAATAQYLGTIVATDAAGNIILDSRNGVPPTVNLADRNYFQVQRDHPAWGLYISPPQPSKLLGGDLALTLSRRITNPDGSFAGIVAGTVNLDYLHHLLSGLTLGPHGVMALVHTGGALIMRGLRCNSGA